MNRPYTPILIALAAATLVGCSHSAPTTARLVTTQTTTQAPSAAVPVAAVQAAAQPTAQAPVMRDVVTSDAATAPTVASGVTISVLADDQPVPSLPGAEALELGDEGPTADAPRRSVDSNGSAVTNILDPFRPYGVGVRMANSNSVTLEWRTDLDCRAMVYFEKKSLIGGYRRGYVNVAHINEKSKFHQVTIGGLSRFSTYRFTIVGLAPLGFQFPAYPIQQRTRLF